MEKLCFDFCHSECSEESIGMFVVVGILRFAQNSNKGMGDNLSVVMVLADLLLILSDV